MPAGEKLLREFDEEFANSRRFLSAVPDEHLLWKPHEKSMELGRLAWHLSDFPDWTAMTFTRDVLQWADKDAEEAAHGWKGKTRAQMLARFDADLPRARAALAAATDDQMTRRWKMEWAGHTMIDDPREDVYRKWAMNHMVHHRAQLGVYFRLLGVAVPGCYGPSADEMTPEPAVAG